MSNVNDRINLLHLDRKGRRGDVERRLETNVRLGSLFSVQNEDAIWYRIVTASGTEFTGVTLKEADMLCSVAISSYYAGKAN